MGRLTLPPGWSWKMRLCWPALTEVLPGLRPRMAMGPVTSRSPDFASWEESGGISSLYLPLAREMEVLPIDWLAAMTASRREQSAGLHGPGGGSSKRVGLRVSAAAEVAASRHIVGAGLQPAPCDSSTSRSSSSLWPRLRAERTSDEWRCRGWVLFRGPAGGRCGVWGCGACVPGDRAGARSEGAGT